MQSRDAGSWMLFPYPCGVESILLICPSPIITPSCVTCTLAIRTSVCVEHARGKSARGLGHLTVRVSAQLLVALCLGISVYGSEVATEEEKGGLSKEETEMQMAAIQVLAPLLPTFFSSSSSAHRIDPPPFSG
jgi:hypothetical protein